MCILPSDQPQGSVAALLSGQARQQLAVAALCGVPVSHIAAQNHVSKKFVYQQLHKAHQGLEQAFSPPQPPQELLFWLPVTRPWLRQLVLGLVLVCHSSFRGVCELLQDLFDYPLSIGTVHNILHQAVNRAQLINQQQDLSLIRIGAHDEIFQAKKPVLVGACVHSTYCYLLIQEEHRDGDTWGVRLLELLERGFAPQATIADFSELGKFLVGLLLFRHGLFERFGRHVRMLLERSGLAQQEFASRIGVPNDQFTEYLTGETSPSASLMIRMRRLSDRFAKMRSERSD
jgi:hypothetical protein